MKHFITKVLMILLCGLLVSSHSSNAQEFESIFKGGPEDAEQYLEAYSEALMFSFNNGLGSGWYNTAKTHKVLGFDITATVNIANISDENRSFTFNNADYNVLRLANGNSAELPTAVGGETDVMFVITDGQPIVGDDGGVVTYDQNSEFAAPDGFDVNDLPIAGFPVPALQLGVGLPKNTDLILRYASDFGAAGDEGSFNLFGLGVKHDLKQWIPGLKQVPFDLSGFMAYTQLNADYNLSVDELDAESGETFKADGAVEMRASSFVVQGVISKKFSIVTPYLGLGYNIAGSSLEVNGEFEYADAEDNELARFNDPISLDFSGASSPRINVGMQIKLLVLTLHAEYAIQEYNTFTAGVGISVR